jgi:hypothetical protein
MSWRGGERLRRCLNSIARAHWHFQRILISVTGAPNSEDMRIVEEFRPRIPDLEILCTGRELPTMEHQTRWVEYLQHTGARPSDWIYWLAYDDEVRPQGIDEIVEASGSWPLEQGMAYFGPWAMRHEGPESLWRGDPSEPLESWTSFPPDGPTVLPVATWIRDQFRQPTYMQMSGSVNPLKSFLHLGDAWPRKRGPMRIEMAIATAPNTRVVQEFSTPICIIYGRSNSDRAAYGGSARVEDLHLSARLLRYGVHHPSSIPTLTRAVVDVIGAYTRRTHPHEEWRVRALVSP